MELSTARVEGVCGVIGLGVSKMQTCKQGEVYGSRITMHMPTLSLHGPERRRTIGYGDVGQLHNGQKLSVNWGQSDSTEGKALSLHKTNPDLIPIILYGPLNSRNRL